MKHIVAIITAIALGGAAYAGCGKKVTVTGKGAYDAEKKVLTIEGAKKPIKLQASTKVTDKDGKKAKIEDIAKEGAKLTVVHEHNKADAVSPAKEKKKS